MLMLVTADNLVQMFFGWEGVGPRILSADRLLVPQAVANAAALKAFVVNRVGDFGFSLGIFGTFLVSAPSSSPRFSQPRRRWRARLSASSACASTS
jgi:NADH-quinone oxidoreductase subunit L